MTTWPNRPRTTDDRGWWDEPEERREEQERAVHVVFVDGRLVETWAEPVEGTRWDRPRPAQVRPVVHLPEDPHEKALTWLTELCGSRAALDALDDAPLPASGAASVAGLDRLLDRLGDLCFDDETVRAMRRASLLVTGATGSAVRPAWSAEQLAAGVAWAVGKANGLSGPAAVTQVSVQHALGLVSAITNAGRAVEQELAGHLVWRRDTPRGAPDLLALGRPELLTSRTRRTLISWRDRAAEGRRRAAELHPCTACSAAD